MTRSVLIASVAALALLLSAQTTPATGLSPASAVQELATASGGRARLELHPVTGTARLMRTPPGSLALSGATAEERAADFMAHHGAVFGITDPGRELVLEGSSVDRIGHTHVSFRQQRDGVEVFGARLRLHFDGDGELTVVNGLAIPVDPQLSTSPQVPAATAEDIARHAAAKRPEHPPLSALGVVDRRLVVYRTGLLRGLPGHDHLVWQVEVSDGVAVAEMVLVDAHDGLVVERIDLSHHITRVIHSVSYPNPVWNEGDPLPYAGGEDPSTDQSINELIQYMGETYQLFANLSGGTYLSWDGNDATMHAVYDADFIDCPNAVSYGPVTGFCPGTTSDDVVAHEWAHSYTGRTHGLVYMWQSGALNEAYSDVFGELVDLFNGAGTDDPDTARTGGACSAFGGNDRPRLSVTSPAAIAGDYTAGGASFNPVPPWSVSGEVELVDDGVGNPHDGCQPLVGFTPGKIAIMDFSTCLFQPPARNAEAAGAIGAIIANNGNDSVVEMFGDGTQLSIPSLFIGNADGQTLKAAVAEGLQVTMASVSDPSYRWLVGEDAIAFGDPIRDMWSPGCYGDPAKVSDRSYVCSEADNGGVHSNSGVPNHAFSLLVDGGEFNGQTVGAIGVTKAAHIYWRAMTTYQIPISDFADHADALELSCQDLVGAQLTDLGDGTISDEVISVGDCAQVSAAMAAVEMRVAPSQCHFRPLLDPDAPAAPGGLQVYSESFDSDPGEPWSRSFDAAFSSFEERQWEWTASVPEGGNGGAMYAINVPLGNRCGTNGDQSAVLHLDSPPIALPSGARPVLSFDHYLASEPRRDGGNLKISVNGGPFVLVDESAFLFNPYNRTLDGQDDDSFNPIGGETAFSGLNQGELQSSWGQTQVDLSRWARAGDTIRIRFDFGFDNCIGYDGWYLDNLRITMADPVRGGGDRRAP